MKLGMVAGEASGDLLGGLLMQGLRTRWPALSAVGIGGPRLQAEGLDSWWPAERLAVHGFVDALKVYLPLVKLRRELGDRLLDARPAAFIGIDAPDFNLGLETRLKQAGLPTVHFVCPSIWAWRGGRVKAIAAAADHVLCLFPFEPALLAKSGIAASYVGHPLADALPLDPPRAAARAALGLAEGEIVVGLLPGSRRSEVRFNAAAFAAAGRRLQAARPGLKLLLPVAPGLRGLVEEALAAAGAADAVQLLDGRSHEVMAASDSLIIASGTATLEAALFKRPMVIGYRMAGLNWALMKRMAYQPWVGLPNILAGEFLVPELLQHAMTPEALATATLRWLDDPAACARLAERFTELHLRLRRDTARAAAGALGALLGA